MTFTLTIDETRWNENIRRAAADYPGLVPVIKGNGYGFGRTLLARRAAELGLDTVAVGTESELLSVRSVFGGTTVVMAPLTMADLAGRTGPLRMTEPTVPIATGSSPAQVIRTVAHADVVRRLAEPSSPDPLVVLELDSPVHRHGVQLPELMELAGPLRKVRLAGVAMHLPSGGDRREVVQSVHRALNALREAWIAVDTLWVSHLSPAELAAVSQAQPGLRIRPRVGTDVWLGDRQAFSATGSVLESRRVSHGQAVGYRQRRTAGGTLLVVSGGTAHGVGLHGSAARGGWRDIMRAAALGAAHGAGWAPSPFHWAGRRLHFADVAHMQISMLLVPAGLTPPRIGERLQCDVRMTVSTFDTVEFTRPGTRLLSGQLPGNKFSGAGLRTGEFGPHRQGTGTGQWPTRFAHPG